MGPVVALIVSVVVFMHAWQLFGLSEPKTTGIVGAVGAIALAALAVKVAPEAFATSVLIWAIYAALVAAVGLWGFGSRGLGLYSAYAAVAMIGQIIYSSGTEFSLAGIICGVIQAVAFALLFFHLAIPLDTLKKATAWVLVVVGPIHGILAAMLLMKILA